MLTDHEKSQQLTMLKTMPYALLRLLADLCHMMEDDAKRGVVKMPKDGMTPEQITELMFAPDNRARHYIGVMTSAILMSAHNEEGEANVTAISAFVHTIIEQIIAGDNLFSQALSEKEAEETDDDEDDEDDISGQLDEEVRQSVGKFYVKDELNVEVIPRTLRQDLYTKLPLIRIDDLAMPQVAQVLMQMHRHHLIATKMEMVSKHKCVPSKMEQRMELNTLMRQMHEVLADILHDNALIPPSTETLGIEDCAVMALGLMQEVKEFGHKFVLDRINGAMNDTRGTA